MAEVLAGETLVEAGLRGGRGGGLVAPARGARRVRSGCWSLGRLGKPRLLDNLGVTVPND